MFSSLYSPFFTSGLLSDPVTPRRGSLPSEGSVGRRDGASAFYVKLQPQRDEKEYRSFLSLDLAESQSMRSASFGQFRCPHSWKPTPPMPVPPPVLPFSPLRTRLSRDSLRSIPSPKPAPSITLPAVPSLTPASTSSPPRLPDLPVLPALEIPITSSVPAPAQSSRPPKPNAHRLSVATSTTSSTRVRRFNRSEALAALEGRRRRVPQTTDVSPPKRNTIPNFMNLSDDEDDDTEADGLEMADADDEMADDDDVELTKIVSDSWGFDPILEPEDIVLPITPGYLEAPRNTPSPPTRTARLPFTLLQPRLPLNAFTYTLFGPSALSNSKLKSGPAARHQRRKHSSPHHHLPATTNSSSKKGSTLMKEWHSFIDLQNDDDLSNNTNWSWESFIHVAKIS